MKIIEKVGYVKFKKTERIQRAFFSTKRLRLVEVFFSCLYDFYLVSSDLSTVDVILHDSYPSSLFYCFRNYVDF